MELQSEMQAAPGRRQAERRHYRRFSVLWDGQVVADAATACIVLNISAQGTKLRVPDGATLPSRVVLSLPGRGNFDAELVEQAGTIARMRLLGDPGLVAEAVSDVVPRERFLEQHDTASVALH
jgi:hypothetical protein